MYQSGKTQRKSLNKTHKITDAVPYMQIRERGGQGFMQGQWEVGSCQDHVHSITGQGEGKPERKRDLWAKAVVGIYNITQGGLS